MAVLHGVRFFGQEVRVLKREVHNLVNQPTQYAVESGKSISDHVMMMPNIVDVCFEMTNSDRGVEQAREAFQYFAWLMKKKIPMTLDTEHARYKNMVIASFSPDHRAPYKGAYVAILRLQQVGVVGQGDMISASGGRNPGVLENDGTSKTACAGQYCGQAMPNTDAALGNRCDAFLAGESTTTRAA